MTKRALKVLLSVGFLLALIRGSVFGSRALAAGGLTLAWDPSGDPNVAGYRLYQGTVSQFYTNVIDIGSATSASILDLVPGGTYYFAVTAYDGSGLESGFSGEISYLVPAETPNPVPTTQLSLALGPNGQKVFTGTGPVGLSYNIETSQDLLSWSVVGTVAIDATGTFRFSDDNANEPGNVRFYRLLLSTPSSGSSPKTSQKSTAPAALIQKF